MGQHLGAYFRGVPPSKTSVIHFFAITGISICNQFHAVYFSLTPEYVDAPLQRRAMKVPTHGDPADAKLL